MRVARQLFSPVLALIVTSAVISSLVMSPATALSRPHTITAATPVTTFASGLDEPLGVATDASGDVYMASLCQAACGTRALISEYAPDGAVLAAYT